jgi:hypothetical protein
MSQPGETARLDHSPLFATFQDGFERLLEIAPSEKFFFVVNGESVESTVAQAILISPKVHERLRSAPGNGTFRIDDEHITANDFRRFLTFIGSRVFDGFSEEERSSFLSISGLLGNCQLTYLLIGTLGETTVSDSTGFSRCEIDADHCASQLYSYSIEVIRRIERRMLHEILSSDQLKVESEDDFLRTLIALGSSYFDFWCYIEVSCLTDDGIVVFVENL